MNIKKIVSGFTLIELLVSMTIGGIVFASVMTSYASLTRARQRIDLYRGLQQQGSFVMIRMADKLRDYGIDYSAYPNWPYTDGVIETQELYTNNDYVFELTLDGDFLMNEEPLLSTYVRVVPGSFSFRITPDGDPSSLVHPSYYDLGDPSVSTLDYLTEQVQPKVQIYMELQSTLDEDIVLPIQTTISTRIYN